MLQVYQEFGAKIMEIKVTEINSYKHYLTLTQIFESHVNFMTR